MSAHRWDDLKVRLASAVVMIAVGVIGVWAGGWVFHMLIAVASGVMVWELVCLLDTGRTKSQYVLGAATFFVALAANMIPPSFALPLLMAPAMLGFTRMEQGGTRYAVFTTLILFAGYGMMDLRDDLGLVWMLWLITVVVVTDVFGYFAGRAIGGPKFWPKVSPKKTWSGTVAGWIAAAAVGAFFAWFAGAGIGLMGISIALSMASQIGDIAESALKRKAGVKDSSSLIPGHGGLLDRFDGMLGAAVFLVFADQLVAFPPGIG
ncbi:phosphatidate cytidylyltransferase [Sagittula stellata]|uniref:Phosphatidate cytidylyltransferase n=1 Tax=Sagittula stellata (strain ATCC 700073 / DSM 11524 / E-37) TaxID=388399 RepID=A3K1T4_SAGS3|nr:phosphatidate cytidylyltransferase [Sagittula stellata]EBA08880.1 phosphatidate cytidylyltransferase [Sagittula stellata E-37]